MRSQHGSRFIEHKHLGVARQRLYNFDSLLHTNRQVLNLGVWVNIETKAVRDFTHKFACLSQIDTASKAGWLVTEHHVFGNGENWDQHKVLVHHADAGSHRIARASEFLLDTVKQNAALVGLIKAIEHVHQSRFAGTVFTKQRVNLARFNNQTDFVVGNKRTKSLGDATQLELHKPNSFVTLALI